MRICSILSNNSNELDEIVVQRVAAYLMERETIDCFYIKQNCPFGKLFATIASTTAKTLDKKIRLIYVMVSEDDPVPEVMDDYIIVPHKNFYPRETVLPIIEYMIDASHAVLYNLTNKDMYNICDYTKNKKRKLIMYDYFNFFINADADKAVV